MAEPPQTSSWRIIEADCVEAMRELDDASVDAIVTDPPYGLEFMGKEWDRLDWRDGGAFTKPGIGERQTAWASYGGETANPSCRTCGGRARGAKKCGCENPDWHVRGEDFTPGDRDRARARRMQEWHQAWATEALRVLKPGGHLLAFGGTRTYHRLACAVEDAGFEIRDSLIWLYGSGFPKSLDVAKALDGRIGKQAQGFSNAGDDGREAELKQDKSFRSDYGYQYKPATAEAERWRGWGTALKPGHEPIVVARKPLIGTVAENVQAHGTGAINVDGCRVGFQGEADEQESKGKNRHADFDSAPRANAVYGADGERRGDRGNYDPPGRWPANVALSHLPECEPVGERRVKSNSPTVPQPEFDSPTGQIYGMKAGEGRNGEMSGGYADADGLETVTVWRCAPGCPVAELDAQSGEAGGGFGKRGPNRQMDGWGMGGDLEDVGYGDTGGASRFFYTAKASRAERNAGLDGFEERRAGAEIERGTDAGTGKQRIGVGGMRQNVHPTVKPIALMRWLCRLVTPPGGKILDPFVGSGTTGAAAVLEGFDFVGIEREAEYAQLARARVEWWAEHRGKEAEEVLRQTAKAEAIRAEHEAAGQGELF